MQPLSPAFAGDLVIYPFLFFAHPVSFYSRLFLGSCVPRVMAGRYLDVVPLARMLLPDLTQCDSFESIRFKTKSPARAGDFVV